MGVLSPRLYPYVSSSHTHIRTHTLSLFYVSLSISRASLPRGYRFPLRYAAEARSSVPRSTYTTSRPFHDSPSLSRDEEKKIIGNCVLLHCANSHDGAAIACSGNYYPAPRATRGSSPLSLSLSFSRLCSLTFATPSRGYSS